MKPIPNDILILYETAGLGDDFSNRSWFIAPIKDSMSFVSDFLMNLK